MNRREYNRRTVAAWRRRRRGDDPPKHGLSGYQNYGCRCGECSEANRLK